MPDTTHCMSRNSVLACVYGEFTSPSPSPIPMASRVQLAAVMVRDGEVVPAEACAADEEHRGPTRCPAGGGARVGARLYGSRQEHELIPVNRAPIGALCIDDGRETARRGALSVCYAA